MTLTSVLLLGSCPHVEESEPHGVLLSVVNCISTPHGSLADLVSHI